MSNVLKMAAVGGAAVETDANFNQTVLLLHGDGTNGAQNNTFLDSSTNNFTITRNGNTTQGTFSPFSLAAGEWSNYFDGSGDSLQIANNAAFNLGTGDFTIECWVYLTGDTAQNSGGNRPANLVTAIPTSGTVNGYAFYISGNSSTTGTGFLFENTVSNINYSVTYTGTLAKFTWHHLAVARSGTTTKLYLNGAEVASGTLGNQTVSNSTNATGVGASFYTGYTNNFPGYISNVRIVKGTAVYTSAFTPPTAPLTAITNTSLLTCQSNRFVDNSTNAFAITRNGDVRVTPFSPFAPSAAYDPAVNGGSGYFDGNGDYLSAADNAAFTLGSSDFTIEFWMYNGTSGVRQFIAGQIANTGLNATTSFAALKTSTNKLNCRVCASTTSYDATSTNDLPLNAWTHIAFVRDGNTIRQYINGVEDGTASVTGVTVNDSANTLSIGRLGELNLDYFAGYIAGFRQVVGTCLYPGGTAFTLPTSPPTAVSGTSLLCNFTNAGIYDQTGKNVLETVGNAQVDTSVKKFGLGSMKFDGTDYIKIPSSENFAFGTGDLTVECWFYANSFDAGDNNYIIDFRPSASNGYPLIFIRPNGTSIWLFVDGSARITGSSISTGQWYHVAWTRSGTQSKLFLNGTQTGSTWTDTTNYLAGRPNIAAAWDGTSELNGFIDDLRITKGVARYTANFTPPTKAFADQ